MMRLKPVPTGSTKTRSVNASHDSSFCTSRGGIARQRPVGREVDPLRPDRADVQVRGRRARPAVEDERHGPVEVVAVGDVRDGEDLRRRLLLLAQHEPLRGGRVRRCRSTSRWTPRRAAARGRASSRPLVVAHVRGRYTTDRVPDHGDAPCSFSATASAWSGSSCRVSPAASSNCGPATLARASS